MTHQSNWFHITSLGVAGIGLIGLIGLAAMKPPSSETSAPRAALVSPADKTVFEDLGVAVGAEALFTARADAAGAVSVSFLDDTFANLGYAWDGVLSGEAVVPHLFLSRLPAGLDRVPENADRKALFFRAVLPLVLKANERIEADRKRARHIQATQRAGRKVDALDRLWLAVTSERYRVRAGDFAALLRRMDVVPPSLALAQAAIESGWGTSRFALEGNALFGQWTMDGTGLVPLRREAGKNHRVRTFATLARSVDAYLLNLNAGRSYKEFRNQRARLRKSGRGLDGSALVATLHRYSERGQDYVEEVRGMIAANGLRGLDLARLRPPAGGNSFEVAVRD